MDRRNFLGAAAAAGLALGLNPPRSASAQHSLQADQPRLAGLTLPQLREKYHREAFEEYLPFFLEHAVDHERGGWMCSLDHDGTLVKPNKFGWFQGRGIWWLSYVYNHFQPDPKLLEIAARDCEFMLRHFPESPDSVRWASDVDRDGTVIAPYAGDPFPCYFGIEGMFELARATGDLALRDRALVLFKRQYHYVRRPDTPFFAYPLGTQGFNLSMLHIQLATQFLSHWQDPEVEQIADESLRVVFEHHYNPRIGLFNELLDNNLERIDGFQDHAYLGHGVEVMWLVCKEALRRRDQALFDRAAQLMLRHMEVSWDHIFGGFATAIQVDHGGFEWPTINPAGSMLSFTGVGEFNYMKALWQIGEAMVGAMTVYERSGAEWTGRFMAMMQKVLDEQASLKPHGYPLHALFADRQWTFQPHTSRKGNYHYPRALLLCIESLDRVIANGGHPLGPLA